MEFWNHSVFLFLSKESSYKSYEMLYGIPPFYHQNQMTMLQMIKTCDLRFPSQVTISADAKDLIKKVSFSSIPAIKKIIGFGKTA